MSRCYDDNELRRERKGTYRAEAVPEGGTLHDSTTIVSRRLSFTKYATTHSLVSRSLLLFVGVQHQAVLGSFAMLHHRQVAVTGRPQRHVLPHEVWCFAPQQAGHVFLDVTPRIHGKEMPACRTIIIRRYHDDYYSRH